MKKLLALAAGALLLTVSTSCRPTENKAAEETNATLQTILRRKSVRNYVAGKTVEKDKVEKMLRAGMAAPSGMDKRPWEFIVVDDRSKLDSLADRLSNARMLAKAPMAIIVCADERKSEYWYLDCSAAAQNILLTAESLGLGGVWTASYPYEERMAAVRDVLGTPAHIKPLCVIPIGYPEKKQTPKNKWDESRIHYNGF